MLEPYKMEIKEMILKSEDENKCREILDNLQLLIIEKGMMPTDLQWLSLVSHVSAMVNRSVKIELIQGLNASLFSEVSNASIEMAKLVCDWLPQLHEDEKYLLAIHFETIKNNK
ncbi:PRD domain-containing protein [Gottfriedia sp. NPDC056225]|uniref:PRD domain-containing protein n=1 Tax=Gottfriedia sp. NPDC056225 TaxID=3345751 RepID=UPI001559A13A|nr:PRD domain-containing protein [Arthrobacter citreus]